MATKAGSGQNSGVTASAGAFVHTPTVSQHGHPTTASATHAVESPPMANEH